MKDSCFKISYLSYSTISLNIKQNTQNTIYVPAKDVTNKLRKFLLESPNNFGYFSYTFNKYVEPTAISSKDISSFDDAGFISPGILFIEDIKLKTISVEIVFNNLHERKYFEDIIKKLCNEILLDKDKNNKIKILSKLNYHFSYKNYLKAIIKAKKYIFDGDSYQIKLSQKLSCKLQGNPSLIYENIRRINPSLYNAFVSFDDVIIVCNSPEQLLYVNEKNIITKPIAGTYLKNTSNTNDQNRKIKELFIKDKKELAEHIMLVDLERNDIGKVSEFGSVNVIKLMDIEEYSHLFHIVSTITGKLQKNKDAYDAFLALFPGGTITGCPKKKTMEIIAKLEQCSREIYTGNIGYFFSNGKKFTDAQFNIIIRSLFLKKINPNSNNNIYYLSLHIGGGIVADSQLKKEYQETLWKVYALLDSIGFKGFKKNNI